MDLWLGTVLLFGVSEKREGIIFIFAKAKVF